MKASNLALIYVLLGAARTAAAETRSKTIERPQGPLTVTWGPAPPLPDQGRPVFAELDRNNDGRLTLEETEPHRLLNSDFIYADANRDGVISKAELDRWN